jgi:hypothetical protein
VRSLNNAHLRLRGLRLGNFRNLYLAQCEDKDGAKRWDVVGIDQGLTAVKREVHPEGHDNYMNRVEALITHIVTKVRRSPQSLGVDVCVPLMY